MVPWVQSGTDALLCNDKRILKKTVEETVGDNSGHLGLKNEANFLRKKSLKNQKINLPHPDHKKLKSDRKIQNPIMEKNQP